jgi:hypothetical protein
MDPSEPIYTKQQASILTAVATLQTELRLSREQQARDSALFREQAAKDNAAIVFQLDKLNGSNSRHGEWIAGHIKEGEAQEKRLQRVEDAVDAIDTTVKEAKGGWKVATFVGTLCSAATALIYHLVHLKP